MPKEPSDGGFTLIEIIVTVAVMGLTVAIVVTGLAMSTSTTRYQGNLATADTALRNYADTIKAQMASTCTGTVTSFSTASTPSAPSGYSLTPSIGTSETCPARHAAPTPLTLGVTVGSAGHGPDAGASDTTRVWLWLP